MQYAIISDIHSNIETLEKHRQKLEELAKTNSIVFAGDYVDGYEQETGGGVKVLEFIKEFEEKHDALVLLGNHDLVFLKALGYRTPKSLQEQNFIHWLNIGGEASLMSWIQHFVPVFKQRYQLLEELIDQQSLHAFENFIHKYMQPLVDWLNDHDFYHQDKKLFISHAGVDLDKSLAHQTEDDFVWTRNEMFDTSLTYDDVHPDWQDKVFVFGHTPTCFIRNHYGIQDANPYSVYKPATNIDMYDIDAGSHSGYHTQHLNLFVIDNQGQVIDQEFLTAYKG